MHELWNRKNHQVMVIGEIFQWKSFDEVSNTARRNGSARLMLRRRWSLSTCVEKDVAPVGSRLASYRKKTNPLVGTTCYREIDEWKRPWKFQDLLQRHILTLFLWISGNHCYDVISLIELRKILKNFYLSKLLRELESDKYFFFKSKAK